MNCITLVWVCDEKRLPITKALHGLLLGVGSFFLFLASKTMVMDILVFNTTTQPRYSTHLSRDLSDSPATPVVGAMLCFTMLPDGNTDIITSESDGNTNMIFLARYGPHL